MRGFDLAFVVKHENVAFPRSPGAGKTRLVTRVQGLFRLRGNLGQKVEIMICRK